MTSFKGKRRFALFQTTSDVQELHGPCCFTTAILGPMGESVAEFADATLAVYICDLLNSADMAVLNEEGEELAEGEYPYGFAGIDFVEDDDDDEFN